MTARADPTGHRSRPAGARVGTRLPWWGVVLPALAFGALLLMASAGEAGAAESAGWPAQLLEWVGRAVFG